jgi:hypothetical protein
MTTVYSTLIRPSGEPWGNQRIRFVVIAPKPWTVTGERLMPYAVITTDERGYWEIDLVPNEEIDPEGNSYYVCRASLKGSHAVGYSDAELTPDTFVVPISDKPVSLYDCLKTGPIPPTAGVVRLGDLHNVDKGTDSAPPGSVLTTTDVGAWAVLPNKLAVLGDVHQSVAFARYGDPLILRTDAQGNKLWGVNRPSLLAEIEKDIDKPPLGVIIRILASLRTKPLSVTWDDGSLPVEYPGTEVEMHHTYANPGTYYPYVEYSDKSDGVYDLTIELP